LRASEEDDVLIRWCSYCQQYIDDGPPWEDFRLTHTICDSCRSKGAHRGEARLEQAQRIAALYGRVRKAAAARQRLETSQLMDECSSLGVRPIDLMMGMIQPALQEIGELWSRGRVTVAIEHQFSAFAQDLLAMVFARFRALFTYRQSSHPRVLLTNAEGNYHDIGIRMAELYLAMAQVPTFTVLPGLPSSEVVSLVQELQPAYLGISVALSSQVRSVQETAAAILGIPADKRPTIILGGFPVRSGLEVGGEPGIIAVKNLAELSRIGVL
jgi:methanogenic corrinoid protein MtbC1